MLYCLRRGYCFPNFECQLCQALEVEVCPLVWHVLTARDTMNLHLLMELQVIEQLRRDQEILACTLGTCNVHHALVNHALVAWVHTLIDLVHNTERRARKTLERHEVEDCRDGTFTTGLAV